MPAQTNPAAGSAFCIFKYQAKVVCMRMSHVPQLSPPVSLNLVKSGNSASGHSVPVLLEPLLCCVGDGEEVVR